MTSTGNNNTPPAWTVVSQHETNDLGTNGRVVPGYQVTFQTGGGHQGSVFVPKANYTVDAVRSAVASEAAKLEAVGALSSDS